MNNRNRGVALGVYRTQLLLEALEQNVTTITAGKCASGAFFVGMGRSLLGWGVLCWDAAFFVGMGCSLLGWGVLCWDGAFFVGMGRFVGVGCIGWLVRWVGFFG